MFPLYMLKYCKSSRDSRQPIEIPEAFCALRAERQRKEALAHVLNGSNLKALFADIKPVTYPPHLVSCLSGRIGAAGQNRPRAHSVLFPCMHFHSFRLLGDGMTESTCKTYH